MIFALIAYILTIVNEGNLFSLRAPEGVAHELAQKVRQLRLARKWKQATLATRAGVTLASLRRFESTGQISLKSLLRISFALGRLDDFEALLHQPEAGSIRELEALEARPKPQRGTQ